MDELAHRYPPLNGGATCLDLANTLEPEADGGRDRDHLGSDRRNPDYPGLLAWASYAGVVDDGTRQRLTALAGKQPADAAAVVADVVDLRRVILAIFTPVAAGATPPAEALDRLRHSYARAVAAATLRTGGGPAHWAWNPGADMAGPLRPVVASAVELLTSDRLARVKQCHGDRCWVLFVDTTRNGSRRWCQMRYCGTAAKSRRQAAQRRQARAHRRPLDPSRPV